MAKLLLQENKARQIFRKTNISYPLIGTRACAYQGGGKCSFFKKLEFSIENLEVLLFCLITENWR